MIKVEFSDQELTYLQVALKQRELELLALEQEEMEDTVTDLIFVQALSRKLKAARQA